jgi:hypothetical protein
MTPLHVRLGETRAQDLNLDLGPPLRVHYRDDERMKIHAVDPSSQPEGATSCKAPRSVHNSWSRLRFPDFYNYFQHGIDFLIAGETHVISKIILHTNIVSGVTRKSNFDYSNHSWRSQDLLCFNAISDANGK